MILGTDIIKYGGIFHIYIVSLLLLLKIYLKLSTNLIKMIKLHKGENSDE